jgi:hypothetical protein
VVALGSVAMASTTATIPAVGTVASTGLGVGVGVGVGVDFSALARRARRVYIRELWTGCYVRFDNSGGAHSGSVMADALAGQWYARASGLPPVLPHHMAVAAYGHIFQYNVLEFARRAASPTALITAAFLPATATGDEVRLPEAAMPRGVHLGSRSAAERGLPLLGAVNGMSPDGCVDDSCMQSREVWTGTTYALAAGILYSIDMYCIYLTDSAPTQSSSIQSNPIEFHRIEPNLIHVYLYSRSRQVCFSRHVLGHWTCQATPT